LKEILSRCGDRVEAHVLFYTPRGGGPDWARTDLWDRAAATPGVNVWIDAGGAEGRRFGAVTSGQVCLYDPPGDLRFSGGITSGRGQAGDNVGRAAVIGHVLGTGQVPVRADVFGCPLERTQTFGGTTEEGACQQAQ
jgi:hypothetical protein